MVEKKSGRSGGSGGFGLFVGVVGNPSIPEVSWSDAQLEEIKALGVNAVQLSIAWGNKPANEVLNLEDLDEEHLAKFDWRVAQAAKHGLRPFAHFGIPRMVKYEPVEAACLMDPAVRETYRTLLSDFLRRYPTVADVLVYTFDQRAWLCSEFGPCPRCGGVPLGERLPEFLDFLANVMRQANPSCRLWWKPWELSKGQVQVVLQRVQARNLGLVLNPSTSNEVYPFNDRSFWSDLGIRRMVEAAHDRGIPILGEFDHTLYKPLYLMEDYCPRHVYETLHGWKQISGLAGVKEYYGFASAAFSVNAAMLKAWMADPEASLDVLLERIAEPYGAAAPGMLAAWELVARSVEAYPWDVTYLIGPMGLERTAPRTHAWTPAEIPSSTWDTPIWKANRRAHFMLTEEALTHPWVFEDTALRLEEAARLSFEAAAAFGRALAAGSPLREDIEAQHLMLNNTGHALRAVSLHFLETLAAEHVRHFGGDAERQGRAIKRLESLLEQDLENQSGEPAMKDQLDAFRSDPLTWLQNNLNPDKPCTDDTPYFMTRTRVDRKVWGRPIGG